MSKDQYVIRLRAVGTRPWFYWTDSSPTTSGSMVRAKRYDRRIGADFQAQWLRTEARLYGLAALEVEVVPYILAN